MRLSPVESICVEDCVATVESSELHSKSQMFLRSLSILSKEELFWNRCQAFFLCRSNSQCWCESHVPRFRQLLTSEGIEDNFESFDDKEILSDERKGRFRPGQVLQDAIDSFLSFARV